ncbi:MULTISPECIES: hypothetical protein [unclassified Plantibacter]|jgi:hypothetical protein|uniref:hypothetical protein n=1 Tax=unclassified Plantibacter TaxID=2624265 RepID=UPI003D336023
MRIAAVYTTGRTEATVEKRSDVLYVVSVEGRDRGFVERAGNVYVALWGHRYASAVEVMQTLDFDAAVERLTTLDQRP